MSGLANKIGSIKMGNKRNGVDVNLDDIFS